MVKNFKNKIEKFALKQHILILISQPLLTEESPLAGIFQWHQAQIIKRLGYKVGILSFYQRSFKTFFKEDKPKPLEDIGIMIYRHYERFWGPTRFYSERGILKKNLNATIKAFDQYVKRFGKPDLIHAHNFVFAGIMAHQIKKKYSIPYLVTEHTSMFFEDRETWDFPKEMWKAHLESKASLAVSHEFGKKLESYLRLDKGFDCLPNVLDPCFESILQSQGLPKNKYDRFTFVNVASLDTNKNQTILLEAFASVLHLPVQLKVVGFGVMEKRLKGKAKALGLGDNIEFMGKLERNQLFEVMSRSHCSILTSKVETFGVALLEGLALGLPIVSSETFGPKDLVNEKNGILVPIDDVTKTREAMQYVYENYKRYEPVSISANAIQKFGAKGFADGLQQFYER